MHIITGKGGVGKTFVAQALVKKLTQNPNLEPVYVAASFEHKVKVDVPHIDLTPLKSAELYLERIFKSKMIAGWITGTRFFQALFNVLPAMSYLIFLGHLIDKLEKNPKLHIVLDSPSTGHALTLFRSIDYFLEIFKTGHLTDDLKKMSEFINGDKIETWILSLPEPLPITEAIELTEKLSPLPCKLVLNNCLMPVLDGEDKIPEVFKYKLDLERKIEREYKNKINLALPHVSDREGLHALADFLPEVIQ